MKKYKGKIYLEYKDVLALKTLDLTELSESTIHKRFYNKNFRDRYGREFIEGSWCISKQTFKKMWVYREVPGRKKGNTTGQK